VAGIVDGHPVEGLDALGNGVDDDDRLIGMLIQQ
jgi:hypothetical protein